MATHYALTRPPLALSPETVLVIDLCPQANVSMAGNGKRERGKRKAERGKMKEQAEKRFKCHKTTFRLLSPA